MKSGLAMSFPAPWWPPTQPAQEQRAPPPHSRAATDSIQASSTTHQTHEARCLEAMALRPKSIYHWGYFAICSWWLQGSQLVIILKEELENNK